MTATKITKIPLSVERIDAFLNYLKRKKRSEATISKYASSVKYFYDFLPDNKVLDSGSLENWRDYLTEAGFAVRTINSRIAACNSFLNYLDCKNWQVSPIAIDPVDKDLELSRDEYHALLKAARSANNEWLYYLIKTFCCLGLSVSELSCLTVSSVVEGNIFAGVKKQPRTIQIPEVLRSEFLNFAKRANINSGAIFKSQNGKPLTKAYIFNELRELCMEAGIPEEKVAPKCLQKLYFRTYATIRSNSSALIEEAYCKILEAEDKAYGWENIAS